MVLLCQYSGCLVMSCQQWLLRHQQTSDRPLLTHDKNRIADAILDSYRQVSNIRRTLAGNQIVDHSDVVGALPVGTAPTISSFSTSYMASIDWAKTTCKTVRESLMFWNLVRLILETLRY